MKKLIWSDRQRDRFNEARKASEGCATHEGLVAVLNSLLEGYDQKPRASANRSWVSRVCTKRQRLTEAEVRWLTQAVGVPSDYFLEEQKPDVKLGTLSEQLIEDLKRARGNATLKAFVSGRDSSEKDLSASILSCYYRVLASPDKQENQGSGGGRLMIVKRRKNQYEIITCLAAMLQILGTNGELVTQHQVSTVARMVSNAAVIGGGNHADSPALTVEVLELLVGKITLYVLEPQQCGRTDGVPVEAEEKKTLLDIARTNPTSYFAFYSNDQSFSRHYYSVSQTQFGELDVDDSALNARRFADIESRHQVDFDKKEMGVEELRNGIQKTAVGLNISFGSTVD